MTSLEAIIDYVTQRQLILFGHVSCMNQSSNEFVTIRKKKKRKTKKYRKRRGTKTTQQSKKTFVKYNLLLSRQ